MADMNYFDAIALEESESIARQTRAEMEESVAWMIGMIEETISFWNNNVVGKGGASTSSRLGSDESENGTDTYMDENGNIYIDPNGTGKKYIVHSEDILDRISVGENGPSIDFSSLSMVAIILPDAVSWEKLFKIFIIKST